MAFDSQIRFSTTNPGMAREIGTGMAQIDVKDGLRTVTLGDLLPEQGIAEVMALYERGEAVAKNLKPILAKYESVLAEKGVLVGYLAYALEYVLTHKGA